MFLHILTIKGYNFCSVWDTEHQGDVMMIGWWARSQNCEMHLPALSCLSVRLSAWNNAAPTGGISIKFDI